MKSLGIAIATLVLAGCASPQPLATPSKQPEVTITGHTVEEVRAAFVNHYLSKQFAVVASDTLTVTMEKQATTGMSLMMGIAYGQGSDPNARVRLVGTLLPLPDGSVRLLSSAHMYSQRGTMQLDGKNQTTLQAGLIEIAATLAPK